MAATIFGITAGIKPGPLGIFVIHQTLSRGTAVGLRSCFAPFISDGPIIAIALLVTVHLQSIQWFLVSISILGGFYLFFIAYKIWKSSHTIGDTTQSPKSTFFMAVKINLLNPAPYIFWFTIGSSYISKGTAFEATIFIFFCLFSLALTKFFLAFTIKKLGDRFNTTIYTALLKSLSIPLVIFACLLIYDGIILIRSI